jgi:formylglycine-generating enzyme required for sulfatase activity
LINIPPPGTLKIGENLFADESEITNIDYREFMFWKERIYGKESNEFREIIPDTTVWQYQKYIPHLSTSYLNHPLYNIYPVVGISLDQAKEYTKWRTERVAELFLIKRGFIIADTLPNPENFFTIDRYLKGNYDWIIKKEDVMLPKYRIPNIEEWEFIAKGNSIFKLGVDSLAKVNRKIKRRRNNLFCTLEYVTSSQNQFYDKEKEKTGTINLTAPRLIFAENVFGLLGIVGNVSELVINEGFSKGGSWKNSINEISIEKNNIFNKPNCWTGFRNICTWKLAKIKNGS